MPAGARNVGAVSLTALKKRAEDESPEAEEARARRKVEIAKQIAQRETIEQRDALLGLGLSHPYAALQRVEIKGMQRLAELEHHVIGGIYHRIDRPDASTAQSLDHIKWGRSGDINISDDAPQITRAIS